MAADQSAPEAPVMRDVAKVLALLRGGDLLARYRAAGWRLVLEDVAVAPEAAELLMRGGPEREPYGGRLVPLEGALLPGSLMQTWAWVDDGKRSEREP